MKMSFVGKKLGSQPDNDGDFSIKWDDLFINQSGSPHAQFGGDLLKVSLGADYKVKGGLVATIEGDLGDAALEYVINADDFIPSKPKYGLASIDTSDWKVESGSLTVSSFDPKDFHISADISADIKLNLKEDV